MGTAKIIPGIPCWEGQRKSRSKNQQKKNIKRHLAHGTLRQHREKINLQYFRTFRRKTHDLFSRCRLNRCASKEQATTTRAHASRNAYKQKTGTGAKRLGIPFRSASPEPRPQPPLKNNRQRKRILPTRSPRRRGKGGPRQETARKTLRIGRAPRGYRQAGAPEKNQKRTTKYDKASSHGPPSRGTEKIQPSARNKHARGRKRNVHVNLHQLELQLSTFNFLAVPSNAGRSRKTRNMSENSQQRHRYHRNDASTILQHSRP